MTCQYLIGICSKTRLLCPHCAVDGKCDEAVCANSVVPTWQELLDIYDAAVKPTRSRMANIRAAFSAMTKALDTTLDAKVAVTDEQMDAAYQALMSRYAPETVDTVFGAFKATTSSRREVRIEYNRRGKVAPNISFPKVEKRKKPIAQLTEKQRIAIREKMILLRTSANKNDKPRYLWLWFAFNFGMRPKDICSIKWDCIKCHSNGSWWLDYTPTKTVKYGTHAGCRLTETLIEEIRPFIGDADSYVIPRHENRRPKSGCVKLGHGETAGLHKSIRDYFIKFMRSIGVDDLKPQYVLRKECSQRTIRDKGLLHEAQLLGHTPKIALRNYADISKMDLKDGV